MPEKPYKSRLWGLLKTAFCARFVPNALFQTKNCLLLQGQSKTKMKKPLKNQGFSHGRSGGIRARGLLALN